eukprot:gene15375-biopygen4962
MTPKGLGAPVTLGAAVAGRGRLRGKGVALRAAGSVLCGTAVGARDTPARGSACDDDQRGRLAVGAGAAVGSDRRGRWFEASTRVGHVGPCDRRGAGIERLVVRRVLTLHPWAMFTLQRLSEGRRVGEEG